MQSESRTLTAARGLFRRYQSPQCAAINRAQAARTERARLFWLGVVHFLFKPYPCQSWTDDDLRRWRLIRA